MLNVVVKLLLLTLLVNHLLREGIKSMLFRRFKRRHRATPDRLPDQKPKERCAAFPRCSEFICETTEPVLYTARRGSDLKFCTAGCYRMFLGIPAPT